MSDVLTPQVLAAIQASPHNTEGTVWYAFATPSGNFIYKPYGPDHEAMEPETALLPFMLGRVDLNTGKLVPLESKAEHRMIKAVLRTYLDKEGHYEDDIIHVRADHDFSRGPYQDTVPVTVGSNQAVLPLEITIP